MHYTPQSYVKLSTPPRVFPLIDIHVVVSQFLFFSTFIRSLTCSMNCLGCFVFLACGFVKRIAVQCKAHIICAGKRVHPVVSLIFVL